MSKYSHQSTGLRPLQPTFFLNVTDQVSNPYNRKREQEVEYDVESDKILATNCTYGD
jgi:hypothetical protein